MSELTPPPVAFTGLCGEAGIIQIGDPQVSTWHLGAVRDGVAFPVYPTSLTPFYFVFSLYNPAEFPGGHVVIENSDGEELYRVGLFRPDTDDIDLLEDRSDKDFKARKADDGEVDLLETLWARGESGWAMVAHKIDDFWLWEPTSVRLFYVGINGERSQIGHLNFTLQPATNLTEERVAAIRSHPLTTKTVRYEIACESCGEILRTYASIEEKEELEKQGFTRHNELGETYECACGDLNFSLYYLRENLHAFLGNKKGGTGPVKASGQYTGEALIEISEDFLAFLDDEPSEPEVQKYIENEPVLLQAFSPKNIYFKPELLGEYEPDIVILTVRQELLIIELERPGKKLLRKDGQITAKTQHAERQVTDYLQILDEDRSTVLRRSLGLHPDRVNKIRGALIMGRNRDYPDDHLRKMRWEDRGRHEVYTYDYLVRHLGSVLRSTQKLL